MIAISMADANDFVESVILDGTAYRLHFAWNGVAGQWSMDVRTNSNDDIIRGIAVVPNFPLLQQCRRNGAPDGELAAVVVNPELAENQAIGRDGFTSGRFSLVYIPKSEVEDILGRATE